MEWICPRSRRWRWRVPHDRASSSAATTWRTPADWGKYGRTRRADRLLTRGAPGTTDQRRRPPWGNGARGVCAGSFGWPASSSRRGVRVRRPRRYVPLGRRQADGDVEAWRCVLYPLWRRTRRTKYRCDEGRSRFGLLCGGRQTVGDTSVINREQSTTVTFVRLSEVPGKVTLGLTKNVNDRPAIGRQQTRISRASAP